MECVVCPASLSHFPPNAAVGPSAPPHSPECVLCTMLLRSVMHIPTLLLQVVGVVQMLQWQRGSSVVANCLSGIFQAWSVPRRTTQA